MKRVFVLAISLLLLMACEDNSRLVVDVSEEEIDFKVKHFEKEFFEADKYKLKELNETWIKEYGILYESFIYQMLNEGSVHDPMIAFRLEKFLNDSTMQLVYSQIKDLYGDFSIYENELKNGFKHYKYHFKDSLVPQVVTFYSNFNAKAFPTNSILGIGLDMYLGADNYIVKSLPYEIFPAYFKRKMTKEYLVTETMKYWLYYKFSSRKIFQNYTVYTIKDDFLNTIVHHGKMMYLLEAMLPKSKEETRFCYSKEQLEWCKQNEKSVYQYLIENNLIYSTNHKAISKYVNDGPFTTGLTEVSPSMTGVWVGYQMVKTYMDENPTITLEELVYKEINSRRILSFYRR
jgi:hypothetical protein